MKYDVIIGKLIINNDAVSIASDQGLFVLQDDVLLEVEMEEGYFEPFKVELITDGMNGMKAKLRCRKDDL